LALSNISISSSGELIETDKDGKETKISYDFLTKKKFVENVSEKYKKHSLNSAYSNELFLQYFVKKKEWTELINENNYTEFDSVQPKTIYNSIWNDIVKEQEQEQESPFFFFRLKTEIYSLFLLIKLCFISLFLSTWAVLKATKHKKNKLSSTIAVVRSKASYDKLNNVKSLLDIDLICEDIVYKNKNIPSMFNYLSSYELIKLIPFLIMNGVNDFRIVKKECNLYLSHHTCNMILSHYVSRIVLKCLFESSLKLIVKVHRPTNMYTGNKEDRFAMVEKKVTRQRGVKLFCIPHGLEYGFKFPTGVAGDVFYCTSKATQNVLAKLYDEQEFIYDETLQSIIFSFCGDKIKHRKIIFFTESRDIEVNKEIIRDLIDLKIKFKVKLHPKDSPINYEAFDINYIEDYVQSLTNSICLARKSTVLIECLFNNSIAVSYLIDSKDNYYVAQVFPSLSDKLITKCHNKKQLIGVFNQLIKE
jgi:hypothetical protein